MYVLQEVDTAIIKLQGEGDSSDLLRFLEHTDIACSLPECTQWLINSKQYSALAKLYRQGYNSSFLGLLEHRFMHFLITAHRL